MYIHSLTSVLLTLPLLSIASTVSHGLRPRDLAITTNLPAQWTYQGCFVDNANDRQLVSTINYSDSKNMTQESCIAYCNANGATYAGLEFSQECFCSLGTGPSMTYRYGSECNLPCTGNSAQACGGNQRITLFMKTTRAPEIASSPDGWAYSGCYTDSSSRTLPVGVAVPGAMSVGACLSQCKAAGYSMAGVEYGNECWCGNQLASQATLDQGGCNMPCTAENYNQCGGRWRLNVYRQVTGPGPIPASCKALPNNCYIDSFENRTLPVRVYPQPDALTVGSCLQTCVGQGYKYAGVEYANECWCGNTLNGPGSDVDAQYRCFNVCKGNSRELCGGPWRLNVYQCGS